MDLGFKNNLFSLSKNKTVNLNNYADTSSEQGKIKITVEEKKESTGNLIKKEISIPREYFGKIIGTVNLPNTISDWTTCKNALDFLQEKMSYIRKTITSWDVLNLQDTITAPENAVEKIENLLPNSSLMVVFDDANQSFNYNDQDYKTGDMFVKAFDGTIIPIKGAVEKGRYTPTDLTIINNTVKILYEWKTENTNSVNLTLQSSFSSIQPTAYSIKETINKSSSLEIPELEHPSSLEKGIIPIIKFYYNNELIESDKITIKEINENNKKKYKITNDLPFDINVEVK